jgi:branched-chain amino acid transport system substrate-binding protein
MKKKLVLVCILLIIALVVVLIVTQTKKVSGTLKIGAILTLSGDAAPYGESAKNAIDMAVNEINNNNLLKNKKLSVIYEDDQLDPKTGVNAFRKLVEINKVSVIVGPLTSSVALAIAPVANEKTIVLLSPSASSPLLTNAGDYIFRNVASDEYETKVMAQYVTEALKAKRIGIVYINNDFGVGYKEFFSKFIRQKGGEIPVAESYEQGSSDFRTQLLKMKTNLIDAIYIIGYKEMGRVLRQARELGIKSIFLSYSAIEDPDIITQANNAAEGLIYTRQSFDPDDPDNVVNKFSTSYRTLYKKDPDAYAALSYDAINILAKAISEGGVNSEGIKTALYGIKNFPGVTGRTTFDANGDVTKSISIKEIKNGKFDYLIKNYFNQ